MPPELYSMADGQAAIVRIDNRDDGNIVGVAAILASYADAIRVLREVKRDKPAMLKRLDVVKQCAGKLMLVSWVV